MPSSGRPSAPDARAGVPVVVFMTDPPSLRTRFDHGLGLLMKRVDKRLIESGLRSVDGVVSLTKPLAEDFAPGKPVLLMEGIARPVHSETSDVPPDHELRTSPVVLYAGGLRKEYGVEALLEAVRASHGSWELHLYGRGPMEEDCRKAADEDARVVFHGVADSQTLGRAYSCATVLVNPRQLDADFIKYSFPSKLLEYMTTGTPVVTTHLPTIPTAYDPFLIYTPDDASSIARCLDKAVARDARELHDLGSAARVFIRDTCSPRAQGARITAFLATLSKESERSA